MDYFWIAVGASEFVTRGERTGPEKVVAPDGSVHFTRGGFAHLARIDGDQAFQNVTLELPQAQTQPAEPLRGGASRTSRSTARPR